jgi:hypothetical protein
MKLIKHNNAVGLNAALEQKLIQADESYLEMDCAHPMINYAVIMNKKEIVKMLLYHEGKTGLISEPQHSRRLQDDPSHTGMCSGPIRHRKGAYRWRR